jgi:hypothetical protein
VWRCGGVASGEIMVEGCLPKQDEPCTQQGFGLAQR